MNPSWQNSIDSIKAIPEIFTYVVVRNEKNIVGYGILDKKSGDIPQFAVHKKYRGKGIGHSIMAEIVKIAESEKLRVINIESKQEVIKQFLVTLGFENHVGQFEMVLKL